MENTVSNVLTFLAADIDFMSMMKFIAMFAAGVLLVGFLGRIILGKRSGLNHSVSSAMGILCIYALTIVVYTFNPYELSRFLAPLPFVTFHGETLQIFSFTSAELPAICTQVLSMVILAFLVNLLDTWIPKGKKVIGWYMYRFVTVVLAMVLHYLVTWAFNTFLPDMLVTYAPTILVGLLAAMLVLGVLNVILSLVLTVANPIIGAIYTFFFSNVIGKQLTKAVVTTIILCAVVYVLNYSGYAVISVSATALGAYIPLIASQLILWYVVGHVL